ncbi:MAG: hypothetical protein ACRBF0_21135 [Calditrichia bacterium]
MKFFAKILLFSYFLGILTPVIPVIDFQMRWDYIAKNLCVNKDNPISTCAGKCYLNKKIKQSSDEGENNPTSSSQLLAKDNSPHYTTTGIDYAGRLQTLHKNPVVATTLSPQHDPSIEIPPPQFS